MNGVVVEVNVRMFDRDLTLVNVDGIEWNLKQLLYADDLHW